MNFFDNSDYRINKIFMAALGQWPYQPFIQKILIRSLCIILNCTMIFTMVAGIITYKEFDDALKLMASSLTALASGARYVNCIINSNRMKTLLDQMQLDWTLISGLESDILKKFSKRGKFLTVIYEVYVYSSLFIYFLNGLSPQILNIIRPLNESRPWTRTYQSNYFVDEKKYYTQMVIHEYLTCFINVTTMLAVDSLYAVYTEHVCGMFAILRYRIENIIQDSEDEDNVLVKEKSCSEENDRITKDILKCIYLHQSNIKFATTLNHIFSAPLLLQTANTIVSLSITGYMIVLKLDKMDECVQFFCYTTIQLALLLYSCLPGEKLKNSSEAVVNSVYSSLWYKMSVKSQKILILLIMRSSQSCELQAGGLFILSLEFYTSCMRTSFSYFTVLLSMQKNKDE